MNLKLIKMGKLELKHLAAYLPYGLRCIVSETNSSLDDFKSHVTALRITDNEAQCGYDFYPMLCIKPILRPLSDLTKEIEVDGEKFVPIVELAKRSYPGENWRLTSDRAASPRSNFSFNSNSFWAYNYIADRNETIYNQLDLFQKLFEYHFDVFGLIDARLAIDINTINK